MSSRRLHSQVASLSASLANLIEARFPKHDPQAAEGVSFLRRQTGEIEGKASKKPQITPLDRLARSFSLDDFDVQLLVLAGMAEEHEGFAAIFRGLHPRGDSRPTVALAAQLLADGDTDRLRLRERLESGSLIRSAIVTLGDGVFYERSLIVASWLWSALHGLDARPPFLHLTRGLGATAGLEDWLNRPAAVRARKTLERSEPVTIVVCGDQPDAAFERALALVRSASKECFSVDWTGDTAHENPLLVACAVRGEIPLFRLPGPDGPVSVPAPSMRLSHGPAVVSVKTGGFEGIPERPVIVVPVEELSLEARQRSWAGHLPPLAARADWLGARFPFEPSAIAAVASDVRAVESLEGRAPTTDDVLSAARGRTSRSLSAGVQLISPKACWADLVLPADRLQQLEEAVARLESQRKVLGEWGFLAGRTGARGVRMLFAGPPGTGKTFCAEVVAKELQADLLLVDISRVVSKWIGETERNLAQVFDAAERTRAVLFFDEADALFGRRTEVSDAHDRYANLETAYLLSRLERYDGLAILATNLRANIDPAFIRRIEFVVDFQEPDREDRARLWRRHFPESAPLAADVNLHELAAAYPMVGAVIRNAATAAAFLAARDGLPIERAHILHAIRREFEKAGRAFSGNALRAAPGTVSESLVRTARTPRTE